MGFSLVGSRCFPSFRLILVKSLKMLRVFPFCPQYTSSMRAKYLANSRPEPNPETPPDQ